MKKIINSFLNLLNGFFAVFMSCGAMILIGIPFVIYQLIFPNSKYIKKIKEELKKEKDYDIYRKKKIQ